MMHLQVFQSVSHRPRLWVVATLEKNKNCHRFLNFVVVKVELQIGSSEGRKQWLAPNTVTDRR
jgi:hypothetical protein